MGFGHINLADDPNRAIARPDSVNWADPNRAIVRSDSVNLADTEMTIKIFATVDDKKAEGYFLSFFYIELYVQCTI